MQWYAAPDTVRIDLGDSEWIEVKKELTKGERDRANEMLFKESERDGKLIAVDVARMSKAEAVAYLVAWSVKGLDGQPMPIGTDAEKLSALDNMREAAFDVISEAIKTHVEKMEAERPSKKAKRGVRESLATSASAA